MKRKFISAVLFGALIASSTSTLVSCKDYDDDIDGLRTELASDASTLEELVKWKQNEATSQLASLQDSKTQLENQLAQAKSELATAIEEVKAIAEGNKAELVKANSEIEALKTRVAALEASLVNVESSISQLSGAIEDAKNELNAKIATEQERINALLEADKVLTQAAATAQAAAEAAQKTADDAATAAAAAQGTADKNATDIAAISSKLETVSTNLDKVTSDVNLLKEGLEELKAAAATKADVEAQITQVTSLIETNTELITALQNKDAQLEDDILFNSNELLRLGNQLTLLQTTVANNLDVAKAYTDTKCEELKAELGGDINAVKADLAAILIRVDAAEKNIAALQEFMKKQETTNGEVSAELQALNDKILAANNTSEAAINGVKTEIGAVAQSLSELAGRVDGIDLTIAGIQETIAANKKATDELIEQNRQKAEQGLADLKDELRTWTNEQITTAVNNLTGKYDAALGDAKGTLGELETTVGNLETRLSTLEGLDISKRLEALEVAIKTLTGDEGTIKNLNALAEGLRTDLNALDEKVDGQFNELLRVIREVMLGVSTLVEEEETDLTKAFREMLTALKQVSDGSYSYLQTLIVSGDGRLKSLVFSPEVYYQGIEAIGVYTYEYQALKLTNADLTLDQSNDKGGSRAKLTTYVVPEVIASYYLNPSNANVDVGDDAAELAKRYEFIMNNAAYTRSAVASDITIKSVSRAASKGLVNVVFSMDNAETISNIPATGDGKVDVVALRYKDYTGENDTIITSDYAALKRYQVKNFYINMAAKEGATESLNQNHLAVTAADAIDLKKGKPRFSLPYDDEKGIDLNKWINVHYDYSTNEDVLWGGQETINKKGFSLTYELIGYLSPNYGTNESLHARIEEGHILKIQGYGEDTEKGRQIIGRTPLVRVVLVDDNNNQNVEVGYFLLEITDKDVEPKSLEADAVHNDYTVECDNDDVLNNVEVIKWDKIENELLAEINMSKDEFEDTYVFDSQNQYSYDTNTKTAKVVPSIGKVVSTVDAEGGHQTNVLKWTITNNEAYNLFKTQDKNSVSTWVKFYPKSEAVKRSDIYVKITWTPSKLNIAPEVTLPESEKYKARAAWYAKASLKRGYDETHMEVQNGTIAGTKCIYDNFLPSLTFTEQPIDIVKDAIKGTYPSLAAVANVEYLFAPTAEQTIKEYRIGNATYKVSVDVDGQVIRLANTGVLLAKIEKSTGKIILSDVAEVKEILNAYDITGEDLSETLTFTVYLKPTTCEPAKDLIKFNTKDGDDNKFDVRVVRPINVLGASLAGNIQLGAASTHTQKVKVDFTDFHGYTPDQFEKNSVKNAKPFWVFYGVKSIQRSDAPIQTTYNGSLASVNEDIFEIVYNKPNATDVPSGDMGSVTYTPRSTQGNHRFTVYIPLVLEYAWGKLPVNVKFDIIPFNGEDSAAKRH